MRLDLVEPVGRIEQDEWDHSVAEVVPAANSGDGGSRGGGRRRQAQMAGQKQRPKISRIRIPDDVPRRLLNRNPTFRGSPRLPEPAPDSRRIRIRQAGHETPLVPHRCPHRITNDVGGPRGEEPQPDQRDKQRLRTVPFQHALSQNRMRRLRGLPCGWIGGHANVSGVLTTIDEEAIRQERGDGSCRGNSFSTTRPRPNAGCASHTTRYDE